MKQSRGGSRGRAVAASVLAIVALSSCVADAQTLGAEPFLDPYGPPAPTHRHEARWDGAWSHSNAWDYSLAAAGAGSILFAEIVLQPRRPPVRWNGPILFDADVRRALRSPGAEARGAAEAVAWGLWGLQLAYPVFVDVPLAWTRYGHRFAEDLFWQDAVTLTLAGAADLGLRDVAARTRPGAYDCLRQGGSDCLGPVESDRSFPGGHTTNGTAAAVLTCTQHLYTQLYGAPGDGLVCAETLASNLTLAVLRVTSDNHWATDQIAGMALGALIGWGVPYAMHFHGHSTAGDGAESDGPEKAPGALVLPMPMALPGGAGLGVTGIF
ncbi:MAG: phosphatase PAP2 family protein [Polyangiaceae bacterium]